MDWVEATLLVATALAALAVGLLAARRPILVRIGARNATRRPRQTAMVVAGLMVGTAIMSASLVAGGSAGYAIRGYVYQSLGTIDESVAVQGYPYFPQDAYGAVRDDANASFFDGITAYSIWQSAVDDGRTGQYEPNLALVGFEGQRGAGFLPFHLTDGSQTDGASLHDDQAILTAHAAESLEARPGDRLQLSYTPPVDPLLPEVTVFRGNVSAAEPVPIPSLPGVPQVTPSLDAPHPFHVNASAARLTLAVAWGTQLFPPPAPPIPSGSELVVHVTSPNGTSYEARASRPPLLLNVSAAPGHSIASGNWTFQVSSGASVQTAYTAATIVAYPVYDLAKLQARAAALEREYGKDLRDRITQISGLAQRRTVNVTVVAVTDGGRGSLFDLRDAVFLPLPVAQHMLERDGAVNVIVVSNPGGIEDGVAGTDRATTILNATIARLQATHPDIPAYQSLQVKQLKHDYVAVADQAGETFTNLLIFAGSLTIVTGLLLLLNIFTVLAEERRSELGMARAVGMTRADLVQGFLVEGSLYALAAAFIGALLGLALAAGMIAILNAVIGSLTARLSFPSIPYRPSWSAVLIAFCVGSLVTFGTILGAATRKARLNVVRAIRRIEEPDHAARSPRGAAAGAVLASLGAAAALTGWLTPRGGPDWVRAIAWQRPLLQVAGPLVAALGLVLVLRTRLARRRALPIAAAALAAVYAINQFFLTREANLRESNVLSPVRGVILTLCVVVLVVHWEALARLLGRALSSVRRLRAIGIPAVSYPLHKKSRTGLTLAMFSVVILSIAFFSIFGALFQTDPARQTGGYDIEARPTLTVGDLAPYAQGHLDPSLVAVNDHLVDFISENPNFITVGGHRVGSFGDYRHNVFGYDQAFVAHQQFKLMAREAAYADDQAAYQDVLDHDDRVIVAYPYSTSERNEDRAHAVGESVELHFGDQSVSLRIVGIQEQYHFNGIWVSKALADRLFPQAQDLYLVRLAPLPPGVTAESVAHQLEEEYRAVGLDAKSTVALVVQEQKSFRQILGAMKLFLGLGLVVGVLSLGIVTSRNVLERRQEIGVLRAIGYTRGQVRRLFFVEMTFTLVVGAAIGVACALLLTYGLWFSLVRQSNIPYVVPWGELGVLVLVAYVVALVATAAPIGRAGKVAPAEALRYLE